MNGVHVSPVQQVIPCWCESQLCSSMTLGDVR
jgi:hypothetical protein